MSGHFYPFPKKSNSTAVKGTVADSTAVKGTVADSTAVKGTVADSTAVKKHRTTKSQKAVAKAMDELSENGLNPDFLLNTGDNFYEGGVTFADVNPRFTENFKNVYDCYKSLNVPWYTIAGNNDWKGTDGIRPQIEMLEGKWTFPAQQYVVHYTFENGVQVRIIMIDTTVLCGTGSSDFRKCKINAEKENEKNAKKETEKDAKKETEKDAKKETEKDAEKDAKKYAEKIANAKKHFTWLRKELREAKRRRVNFLFVVGHCPLHILDKQRGYPCAARVHALMRYYQVQAYFAGHEHNLKYVDLSKAGEHSEPGIDSINTKFIVSGAGSRMENAINKGRFPEAYMKFMEFLYPINVGEVLEIEGEKTRARGALDGGGFVGVEIDADAKKMLAKVNFYAAGMFYNEDDKGVTKKPIEKWHKFEGQEVEINPRSTNVTDENFDICNEFLEVGPQLVDDDHFKLDETERIQSILGTYFCKNLGEIETKDIKKDGNKSEFEWKSVNENWHFEVYAGESFDELRKKLGNGYQKLAESFLSGDLVANSLDKSSSLFYSTSDEKFLLKNIPKEEKYEVDTIIKKLPNYVDHLFNVGEESFLSKIYLVFRIKTEKNGTKDAHEFYAVISDGKTGNGK